MSGKREESTWKMLRKRENNGLLMLRKRDMLLLSQIDGGTVYGFASQGV